MGDTSGDQKYDAGTDSAFDLRIFDPAAISLFRYGGVVRLTLEGDRSFVRVHVYRAFPLSDPGHYYCLQDGAGKDIGVIPDPAGLDAAGRAAAEEELEKRYFVPVVRDVTDVKEEFGTVTWTVDTDRGPKVYVIRQMRDNLVELTPRRILLADVDGNRFEIPDIYKLDPRSLTLVLRNL